MIKGIFIGGILLFLLGCSQMAVPNPPDATRTIVPTRVFTASTEASLKSTVPPENARETPVMNQVPISTPLDPYMEKIVSEAKDNLAKRLSIDPGQIELLDVVSVTWPDGSLGCPQPGMMYIQVQVDGFSIRFRAGDNIYEYHGGGERAPFLCEQVPQ